MSTQTVEDKDFSEPDEVRHFKNGRVELLHTQGGAIGRVDLQPGWRGRIVIAESWEQREAPDGQGDGSGYLAIWDDLSMEISRTSTVRVALVSDPVEDLLDDLRCYVRVILVVLRVVLLVVASVTGCCTRHGGSSGNSPVSYTHLRAHETVLDLVCRLLLEKKKKKK